MKLPNELIPIKNADKKFHEKWTKGRNPLNFPHPFRMLAIGQPNVGKSNTIKNILIRAEPKFQRVYLFHCDASGTKEYDDIGNVNILASLPAPTEWLNDGKKSLVIIDDVNLKALSKEQLSNLDRLCGYCSTHCNLSVIITSQDAFNIPSICRRTWNLLVLWRPRDMDSMATISRKSGMKSKEMRGIFDQLMPNFRDSLWIDMTGVVSPYPLRKNGFEIISKKSESEETKKFDESLDKFEID